MKILTILFILISLAYSAQIDKLKPEFRNLAWTIDKKTSEVVSTLSYLYGTDSIKNDSTFVTQADYDLYIDSLTLWKLTKSCFKKDNTKSKSTIKGGFSDAETKHSNKEWLKVFSDQTLAAYKANNNSTVGNTSCIASSYSNINLFYEKEASSIKEYNKGRIKSYSTQETSYYDTVNYYIVVHKTIQPIDENATYWLYGWTPYTYFYAKPKHTVYPNTIKKVWESTTGLPYTLVKELGILDERIPTIIKNKTPINLDVLLNNQTNYNIHVKCDTCLIKLYDNHLEDNDKVEFTYKKEIENVDIKNAGTNYTIIPSNESYFYLQAMSQGTQGLCTVDILIDGANHIFSMKKGEKISIRLIK